MAIGKPEDDKAQPEIWLDRLVIPEALEKFQPLYTAIQFATHQALPLLPFEQFAPLLAEICKAKQINLADLQTQLIALINAVKKFLDWALHGEGRNSPTTEDQYFRTYSEVQVTNLPPHTITVYIGHLEKIAAIFDKLSSKGFGDLGEFTTLGVDRILISATLRVGKSEQDAIPYKLQPFDIAVAQQRFEKGDLKGVLSVLRDYEENGLFTRDVERLRPLMDHADPKYAQLLGFIYHIWQRTNDLPPAPRPQDLSPEFFKQLKKPTPYGFIQACGVFCASASIPENINKFLKEICPDPKSTTTPQALFTIQTIIFALGSNLDLFIEKFATLPFAAEILDTMEQAMISTQKTRKFFEGVRKDLAPEAAEAALRELYQTIQKRTGGSVPSITEAEFVARTRDLCVEKKVSPLNFGILVTGLVDATNEYSISIAGEAHAKFNSSNKDDFQQYLGRLRSVSQAMVAFDEVIGPSGSIDFPRLGLGMLADATVLRAYGATNSPDEARLQPRSIVAAQVRLEMGDVNLACELVNQYAYDLTPEDFFRLQKFAHCAPPQYAPLVSQLLFLAAHQTKDVFGQGDAEFMSEMAYGTADFRSARIQSPDVSYEELRTLAQIRRLFTKPNLGNDIQFGFNIILAEVVAAKAWKLEDLTATYHKHKTKVFTYLYEFLVERYFHHNEVVTDELTAELMGITCLAIESFVGYSDFETEVRLAVNIVARKFEEQFNIKLPDLSPDYVPSKLYVDVQRQVEIQLKTSTQWNEAEALREMPKNIDVLIQTQGGRASCFLSSFVDNRQRVKVIQAATRIEELTFFYNSMFGKGTAPAGLPVPLLCTYIMEKIHKIPGHLEELLSMASFLEDGVISRGTNSTVLSKGTPMSLFIRLFGQAERGDRCFEDLFRILKNPNSETYYPACVLLGTLISQDRKHQDIYLDLLAKEFFNSPQAFADPQNLLFLRYLTYGCEAKAAIARKFGQLSYIKEVDLTPVTNCLQDEGAFACIIEKARDLQRAKLKPATGAAPDPYAGINFLNSYPDVGLTKERDVAGLAAEIIEHRSIALPEQGAQLSTGFADSPLREVFTKAVVKTDRGTASGPKSLRVLVQLEGADKLKVFCRVMDKGDLQIRILVSGSDKEVIAAGQAQAKGLSPKVFTELNYFVLEILRCIYVRIEEPATPASDPPAPAPKPAADPTPIPPPIPPEVQPQHVRARAKSSMSVILGTKANQAEKQRAAQEKKEINENLRLVRNIFKPLHEGEILTDVPDKLDEITLYVAEKMPGKRGEATQEIFYRKIDSLDAFISLQDKTFTFDQIYARKSRLHSQPLPYLLETVGNPHLHLLKKSQQTEVAAARYALALEDGQREVDQSPVSSVLKIKVDDEPQARRLLEQIKGDFIEKFIASRQREIEQTLQEQNAQHLRDTQLWKAELANADVATAETIREILAQMDATYLSVRAALEADIEAIQEGLSMVPEHAGVKDGLIAFPQPGEFTFNQTFNQGSFISLEDLLAA